MGPSEGKCDEKREPAFCRLSFLLGDRSLVCYNRIYATSLLCRSPISFIDDRIAVSNRASVSRLWRENDNHTGTGGNAFCDSRGFFDDAARFPRTDHTNGFGDSHADD